MNFKPEYFVPTDNRILVQPGPIKWIKVTTTEKGPVRKAPKITEVKEVVTDTKPNYRVGKVISVGSLITDVFSGDWIVYKEGTLAVFDIVIEEGKNILDERDKLPGWITKYDVYGKLTQEAIDIVINYKESEKETSEESK
jgi:hypothetical protein